MTARQYLRQAQSIVKRLEAMAEQLTFLRSAAEHIAPQYSDMPKPQRNIHKSEDAIVRVLDFEERMKVQYEKLAEINDTVDKLEDPMQRTILVKHYFSGKTWRDVASETHYSERTVRNIHAAALAEIDKLIESLP